MRDNSKQYEIIPGFYEDSNPFGYWDGESKGLILTGSSYASLVRDFTVSKSTSIKAEISSQVNFYNLVKAGTEFTSIYLDFEKGIIQPFTNNKKYQGHLTMNGSPVQAAFFIQDKFESKQFSVNAGLRLEYFDLHSNWFRLNDKYINPYYRSTTILDKMESKAKWKLSPRFGAACMLTNTTRMFFNYGYFYQPQQYENLYQIPSTSNQEMVSWNDPNIEPVKTISYEAGFEQTFLKDFLFHVNFYLNSISNISGFVSNNYYAYDFSVTHLSDNIKRTNRGIELSLQKTKGRWLTGFINYTYQVNKTNSSSSSKYYDDHYIQKQWDLRASKIEDKPEPRPFARAAINLHTPDDYGPSLFTHNLLGGLGLNFIIDWQAGGKFTWNPEKRSVVYNVEAVDFLNTALRLDKIVNLGKIKLQVFLDIDNVFNTLRLWDVNNYYYLYSLHLPESNAYNNIPGNDKIGDYRKPGVEFQPMQYIQEIDFSEQPARTKVIFYEKKSGQFWQYTDNKNLPVAERWKIVDAAKIEKINKDKAYIDMPSASTFWFLNPRKIYFGINVSFNF
jgi:outer membrane receptor protein involved in Fe transport